MGCLRRDGYEWVCPSFQEALLALAEAADWNSSNLEAFSATGQLCREFSMSLGQLKKWFSNHRPKVSARADSRPAPAAQVSRSLPRLCAVTQDSMGQGALASARMGLLKHCVASTLPRGFVCATWQLSTSR
jgi:hypothetical protein